MSSDEIGPVYNVPLIDTLPFNTDGPAIGMLQQMPNREDLEQVRKRNERVVAGYEVLLNHYTEGLATIEALRRRVAELDAIRREVGEVHAKADFVAAENAELKAKLSAVNDLIDTYDSIELEYEKQHCIWNCLCDGVYFAIGATKEDAFHNAARATANCGEQPLSEIQAVHDAILRGDD